MQNSSLRQLTSTPPSVYATSTECSRDIRLNPLNVHMTLPLSFEFIC